MSAQVLTDVQLLVGAMDLSAFSGEFAQSVEADMKPANNFAGRGYQIVLPGKTSAVGMIRGHADYASGAVSSSFASSSAGTQQAFSVLPVGTASVAGDPAEFMRGRLNSMKMATGAVGEVADFELNISGDSASVDGFVAAPLASRTTAGLTGTAVQLGAVGATDRLWAAIHVTAAAGTNLVVKVQSDNASNFPSAADQITFSTVSATGWQFLSVAGPLTDDWYRVTATIASSTFTFAAVFGVL